MSETQSVSHNLVALFIDHDNIEISLGERSRSKKYETYDIKKIIEEIKSYGVLAVGRAYIHHFSNEKKYYVYFENGIEPVYTPRFVNEESSKSLADPMMICDIMETVFIKPDVQTYVLLTNDKDFLPVIRKLASYGKKVILMCVAGNALSDKLVSECNMHDFPVKEVPRFKKE